MGGFREQVQSWDTILMVFFTKFAGASNFADFRGISLLACIRKWYVGTLVALVEAAPVRHPWNQVMALGFVKGMSINIIVSPLRNLLSK